MKPLSIWTYYRRHLRYAALLTGASILVTIGIYLLAALTWGIYIEPARSNFMFLSKFSVVAPESDEHGPDPAAMARIRAHPDVAQVIPTKAIWITLPGIVPGEGHGFYLLGLLEEDLPDVLDRSGAILIEGQLPAPRTNGLLLAAQVAASLDLQVGDTLSSSRDPEQFGNIGSPLQVVGIVESDVRLGLLSLEYANAHESYSQFATQFLVAAAPGHETPVAEFLRDEIQTAQSDVQTYQGMNETVMREYLDGLLILVPVVVIGSLAFGLVIIVVNWIALARRLPEYGIAHAIGFGKKWLIKRLTMETVALALLGWAMGIGLSWLILLILKASLFAPQGHDLPIVQLIAIALTLPLPAAVAGVTLISARRTVQRLDPVTIIERGEENQEGHRSQSRSASASSPKPLASTTFYRRHERRAALLIGAMTLMIVAVVFGIFILTVSFDALKPGMQYLTQVSVVRSAGAGQGLDPGIAAQIRAHPAVERVLPMAPRYHLLSVRIPPLISGEASPIAVYSGEMSYLVDLYGLEVMEGRLPQPYTNEVILPESIARNRDLQVGDVIGDPDRPAYPDAERLAAEFVVSGIFARATDPEEENWLGFVSLEFLERHEAFAVPDVPPLIVVAKPGHKAALDDWLENDISGPGVSVLTYRLEDRRARANANSQMLSLALLESLIASVSAIALAVLNYIFIMQRQSEFGLLHALGYSRAQLVWRTMREAALTTGFSWVFGAVLCLMGLLMVQFSLFAPLGLRINLLNPMPWLFMLPFPVAVLVATAGTIAQTLSRLDPVAIIERR